MDYSWDMEGRGLTQSCCMARVPASTMGPVASGQRGWGKKSCHASKVLNREWPLIWQWNYPWASCGASDSFKHWLRKKTDVWIQHATDFNDWPAPSRLFFRLLTPRPSLPRRRWQTVHSYFDSAVYTRSWQQEFLSLHSRRIKKKGGLFFFLVGWSDEIIP